MAFDGITIAAMVQELHRNLDGGRFNKIAQPESDALMITGKGANGQCRLLISASASLPLIYFTGKNKPSPLTAPNFCMLLRKHIGSARISSIRQPGMERVDRRTDGQAQQHHLLRRKPHDPRQYQARFFSHEFCPGGSSGKRLFSSAHTREI